MENRGFFKSLRGKITLRTILVGFLPVLILSAAGYWAFSGLTDAIAGGVSASRTALTKDVVGQTLQADAEVLGRRLDDFMRERISEVKLWVSAPIVVDAARNANAAHLSEGLVGRSIEDVESRFRTRKSLQLFSAAESYLKRQVNASPHFGEAFFTDLNGYNVALTNQTSDFVQSDEGWWQRAWSDGIAIGAVKFDKSADIWSIDISVRIDDPSSGDNLGVIKAVLGVSLIQEVADARVARSEGTRVTVANGDGSLLAETSSGHARDRIMSKSVNVRSDGGALKAAFGADRRGFALDDTWVTGFARSAGGDFYQSVADRFRGFDWVIVIQQPVEIALQPIAGLDAVQTKIDDWKKNFFIVFISVTVLALLFAVVVAFFLARGIVGPVLALRDMAERVSMGDASQAISLDTGDEISDLADSFERMRRSIAVAMRRLRAASGSPPPTA